MRNCRRCGEKWNFSRFELTTISRHFECHNELTQRENETWAWALPRSFTFHIRCSTLPLFTLSPLWCVRRHFARLLLPSLAFFLRLTRINSLVDLEMALKDVPGWWRSAFRGASDTWYFKVNYVSADHVKQRQRMWGKWTHHWYCVSQLCSLCSTAPMSSLLWNGINCL